MYLVLSKNTFTEIKQLKIPDSPLMQVTKTMQVETFRSLLEDKMIA